MDEILRDCIVSLVAIAAIFGILYVVLQTRHRERMSLMEKGLSPDEFSNKSRTLSATLRYGLLGIGIASGILLGNFVASHLDVPREGAFVAMVFLFGGLSLIISFLFDRKMH